jgi:transposase InsO family protein
MHNEKVHVRFGERPCETTGRETGRRARPTPPKLKGPAKRTCFHLFVVIDIFGRYVVGWMIAHRETAELAEQFIADTIDKQQIVAGTLTLHADRGTSMRSKSVAQLLVDLAVTKTHSRPHVSDDRESKRHTPLYLFGRFYCARLSHHRYRNPRYRDLSIALQLKRVRGRAKPIGNLGP